MENDKKKQPTTKEKSLHEDKQSAVKAKPLYEDKQDYKVIKGGNFYYCSLDKYKRRFPTEEAARDFFDTNREQYL